MLLPATLLDSLEGTKGFDRAAFTAVHASGERAVSVRLHPSKPAIMNKEWAMEKIPWCPYGYYLAQRPSFTLDPLFHAGSYYVQEASSMFLWHALTETIGNKGSLKVLDLCAAPGGKTTLLSSFFSDSLIIGNEVIKSRAAVLVENITKWGTDNVIVTNNDPSHFQSLPGYFDVMVIDAPCSGSGLFRKDPDAMEEWSPDSVRLCSQRQQRILADALTALKEDGILVYSTCSYSPEEDEAISDWLVSEMEMQSIQIPLEPEWNIVETVSSHKKAFGYRFYPDKVKGEGFFIAAFQKKATNQIVRLPMTSLIVASKKEIQQVSDFIEFPETSHFFKQGEAIRIIQKRWLNDLQILAQCLYIKKAGMEIGTIKGKDFIPSHELALGLYSLAAVPTVEVDKDQALQYLRRKDFMVNAPRGWVLLAYGGLPIGWVKVLPNRINNYYPAGWRIVNV